MTSGSCNNTFGIDGFVIHEGVMQSMSVLATMKCIIYHTTISFCTFADRHRVSCFNDHSSLSPQPDRTYDLKIGQPTVSYFLKQAAGIEKGAGKTGEKCS